MNAWGDFVRLNLASGGFDGVDTLQALERLASKAGQANVSRREAQQAWRSYQMWAKTQTLKSLVNSF